MTLKRLLTRDGYQVTTALNGQTALRKMKDDGFDLIISDIKMPQMDGIETVKKIRELLAQKGGKSYPRDFYYSLCKRRNLSKGERAQCCWIH